jgi:hypothetical protein
MRWLLIPGGLWTRRRVRRVRWNRQWRCVRRMLLLTAVYGGSLAVVLLLVEAVWAMIH